MLASISSLLFAADVEAPPPLTTEESEPRLFCPERSSAISLTRSVRECFFLSLWRCSPLPMPLLPPNAPPPGRCCGAMGIASEYSAAPCGGR